MVATWKRLGQDLQAAGLHVTNVWQLVRLRVPYPEAVPVLIRWARELPDAEPQTPERDRLLEGIVRALSVPEARPMAADALLDLFPRIDGPLQWIIGSAIEITASVSHSDRILDLVEDAKYGPSRQMLVLALRRVAKNNPRTLEALKVAVDDDTIASQAMMVLASLDPVAAVRLLESKKDQSDPAVAASARKAIKAARAKLDK